MDRRTKICIWIILIGLANFLVYTILYMFIDGEAIRGSVQENADQTVTYLLKSSRGDDTPVSQAVFVYSGIHSISICVTVGAVMLAMLTLAKERIASSMRSTIVRGRTLITILATIIAMIVVIWTIWSIRQFSSQLAHPEPFLPTTTQVVGSGE